MKHTNVISNTLMHKEDMKRRDMRLSLSDIFTSFISINPFAHVAAVNNTATGVAVHFQKK